MTEREELLKLRALLAEKDQLIQKQTAELNKKEQRIEKQRIQIDNMIQALLHARKKMFGASCEKTGMDGQLSLFETIQELAQGLFHEQIKIMVKSYEKTPRKSSVREELLCGLPKDIEEYIINPEETRPKCQGLLKIMVLVRIRVDLKKDCIRM